MGFTFESLSKILQTALLTEIFSKESIEHSKWDIFNLLKLIHSLIPRAELDLLDQLKRRIEDQ
ncbi:hypothetical protein ETU08_04015 [Apibacter muscae]|uniref:hypothetical protein n=1 Tax=Apibacter muscae TaxID=2509004 RepID=UPI0011AD7E59|nr:hypothetical protein [Apibacter muscae]TWP30765.1 hypothetical protein ETU08_04015 [Apibacter muscae]